MNYMTNDVLRYSIKNQLSMVNNFDVGDVIKGVNAKKNFLYIPMMILNSSDYTYDIMQLRIPDKKNIDCTVNSVFNVLNSYNNSYVKQLYNDANYSIDMICDVNDVQFNQIDEVGNYLINIPYKVKIVKLK